MTAYAQWIGGTMDPALARFWHPARLCFGRFNVQRHGDLNRIDGDDLLTANFVCKNCGKVFITAAEINETVARLHTETETP